MFRLYVTHAIFVLYESFTYIFRDFPVTIEVIEGKGKLLPFLATFVQSRAHRNVAGKFLKKIETFSKKHTFSAVFSKQINRTNYELINQRLFKKTQ